jgi:hypothetical protein
MLAITEYQTIWIIGTFVGITLNIIILFWFIVTLNRINASLSSIKEHTEYTNTLLKYQIENPATVTKSQ